MRTTQQGAYPAAIMLAALGLVAQGAATAGVDDGLVVHYDFEGDIGSILTDRSGHGNHAAHGGAAMATCPGERGQGGLFSGGYYTLGGNPTTPLGARSFALRFKSPTPNENYKLMAAGQWAGGYNASGWIVGTSYFENWADGQQGPVFDSASCTGTRWGGHLRPNEWQTLVVTHDPQGWYREYLDGILTHQCRSNGLTMGDAGSSPMAIGTWPQYSSYSTYGCMDEVRVYDRALTPTEVGEYFSRPPLLSSDFDTGAPGWAPPVDEGLWSGPSYWRLLTAAPDAGTLGQTHNIYSDGIAICKDDIECRHLTETGTSRTYGGGFGWGDYRLSLDLRSWDNDTIGVFFRVQDSTHYYALTWNAEVGLLRLYRRDGTGKRNVPIPIVTDLAEPLERPLLVPGQTYHLDLYAVGDSIAVVIDGRLRFQTTDTEYGAGSIALYAAANTGAVFDNLVVTEQNRLGWHPPILTAVQATPMVLGSGESSRLDVAATRPDGSTAGLVYHWTLPAGAGTLDDPNSATPLLSAPPSLSGTRTLTLGVEVKDPQGGVSFGEVAVTLIGDEAQPSWATDFSEGTLSGWRITDEGRFQAPSNWRLRNGVLEQVSNINLPTDRNVIERYRHPAFSDRALNDQEVLDRNAATQTLWHLVAEAGTYAVREDGYGWDDYRLRLDLGSRDNDSIGVMFRVVDETHYYRFTWNAESKVRRLIKRDDDGFRVLAEEQNAPAYLPGRMYPVEITAVGAELRVAVDGREVLSANDASFARGSIGLYGDGSAGALFDNVSVDGL